NGFTGFVGSNNSGKSTLLKFFWEFRQLFGCLSNWNGNLHGALQGGGSGLSFLSTVRDPEELFSNRNERDFTLELDFSHMVGGQLAQPSTSFPTRFVIDFGRAART